MKDGHDTVLKKLRAEKLKASTKYLLKYGRQEDLTTYLFDYAMLTINKIQKRNGIKAASYSSPRKVTFESLKTTEA